MASQRPIPMDLPLGRDPVSALRRIEAMEHLLERSLTIPGLNPLLPANIRGSNLPWTTAEALMAGTVRGLSE